MTYESNVIIRVVSNPPVALGIPITWILPPHYTTSSLLLSSSESYSKWDPQNQKNAVTYSILGHYSATDEHRKSSISIDGKRIKTTDSNSIACIQAKDHTTGRTVVACCVEVAEVAQIRIAKMSHIVDLAVGTEIELMMSYHDYLGNPFHEAYDLIRPDADTSHGDIVVIDSTPSSNGSIIIKALRDGKALVRVRLDDDPHKSDYILISVGAHIYPQNPLLYTGGVSNFCIEGRGLGERVSGQWSSANRSVLIVDPLSGEARAVGEGATTVTYKSSNFTLQTKVSVLKGNFIFVDAPVGTLTNVPSSTRGYNFSVKLSNSESPRGNVAVPYDCKVEPPFIGDVKPWRDVDTGDTYCRFFPYSPEHLAHALPHSKDMRKGISISIHASLTEVPDISGCAPALFVGGFRKRKGFVAAKFDPIF